MLLSFLYNAEKKERKHKILSNDELLYDPDMDKEDEAWVRKQRQNYQPREPAGKKNAENQQRKRPAQKGGLGKESKVQKLPNSDAVLNCPACMVLLCMDCQR